MSEPLQALRYISSVVLCFTLIVMIDRCGSFTSSLLPSLSTGVSEPRNQPKVQSVESGRFKERASRGLCSWLDCVSLICHGCRCCYPIAKVTRSIQRVAASSCRIRWLGDWVARWACQPGRDQWLKRQFISIYVCLCAGPSIPLFPAKICTRSVHYGGDLELEETAKP